MNIQYRSEFVNNPVPELSVPEVPVAIEEHEVTYFRSLERTYGAEQRIKKRLGKLLAKAVIPENIALLQFHIDGVERRLDYLRKIFALVRRPPLGITSKSVKKLLKKYKGKHGADQLTRTSLADVSCYEEVKFRLLKTRAQILGRLSSVGFSELSIVTIREQREKAKRSGINEGQPRGEIEA